DIDIKQLVNDTISGGFTISISNPKNGTATLQSDSVVMYSPTHNYTGKDSIIYQVCLTTCPNICSSATIYITVYKLIIPQVLTPNGDGVNDLFVIQGLNRYPKNELYILDRWGDVLYKAAPYKNN